MNVKQLRDSLRKFPEDLDNVEVILFTLNQLTGQKEFGLLCAVSYSEIPAILLSDERATARLILDGAPQLEKLEEIEPGDEWKKNS